jgi:hypothetical protein
MTANDEPNLGLPYSQIRRSLILLFFLLDALLDN